MLHRHLGRKTKSACLLLVIIVVLVLVYLRYRNLRNVEVRRQQRMLQQFPSNYVYKKKQQQPASDDVLTAGLSPLNVSRVEVTADMGLKQMEDNFYRYIEQKTVKCARNIRYGNQHEGGWNVCLSPPFIIEDPCLVYSFGIGTDWRFEDDMYDRHKCQVLMFDPSISNREHKRMDLMWFQPIGLGAGAPLTDKGWRMKTFKQHLQDEGHLQMDIDYLKFDIEYMEWNVLQTMLADGSLRNVKQLSFEVHFTAVKEHPPSRWQIPKHDFISMYRILRSMEMHGFAKFHFRLNPFCMYRSPYTERSWCYDQHYVNTRFIQSWHWKS